MNVSRIEQSKNIPKIAWDDMVFVSQSVLQLCDIAIADYVLVTAGGNTLVKAVWPTKDKTLTSVSLTKHGKLFIKYCCIINVQIFISMYTYLLQQ